MVNDNTGTGRPYGLAPENRGSALHLDLQTKDNNRCSPSYSYLVLPKFTQTHDGENMQAIKLEYVNVKIYIRGRSLSELYNLILEHRVLWVKESPYPDHHNNPEDNEPFVEAIEILEKDGNR